MKEEAVTTVKYFESLIVEVKDAVKVALTSLDKRLDGMNEFRDTLRDQAGKFITREEMDARFETLNNKLESTQKVVWMGMGMAILISFAFKFLIK